MEGRDVGERRRDGFEVVSSRGLPSRVGVFERHDRPELQSRLWDRYGGNSVDEGSYQRQNPFKSQDRFHAKEPQLITLRLTPPFLSSSCPPATSLPHDRIGAAGTANIQGEDQKKLDIREPLLARL